MPCNTSNSKTIFDYSLLGFIGSVQIYVLLCRAVEEEEFLCVSTLPLKVFFTFLELGGKTIVHDPFNFCNFVGWETF